MRRSLVGTRLTIIAAVMLLILASVATALAAPGTPGSVRKLLSASKTPDGAEEIMQRANERAEARTSPGGVVAPGALLSARAEAQALAVTKGTWTEITKQPYDSDDIRYRDPAFSNSGGGAGLVTGRMTSLAVDGGTVWAGAADGGVWKSTDAGAHWTPVFDDQANTSIGAVAVNPADHSVWVGTGEGNTSSDSYSGVGVYRSADGGATWGHVGGARLNGKLIGRFAFDGFGNVYAATSDGLWKRSASDVSSTEWTHAFDPSCSASTSFGNYKFISDVAVRPGTGGKTVVAVVGARAGTSCNGFYISTDGGATFAYSALNGAINPGDIGRTTLAYSSDGGTFYAMIQSTQLYNAPQIQNGNTLLEGIFISKSGDPTGPWSRIANYQNLENGTGSALYHSKGYSPGVQAWYNQFLGVDPNDASHLYVGLEEIFETTDAGGSWTAIGPYWNFGLPCSANGLDACPKTTHPDQHAVAFGNGTVFFGNDGGVWSRPIRGATEWTDLNATLHTLQYYSASAGPVNGALAFWGGLQDNGQSLLLPGAKTMVSPFGGDGGYTIVDPRNGNNAVVEYVDLDLARTTDGGHTWTEITPSCYPFTYAPIAGCDPSPRFIAPFRADKLNPDHWVAGGRYVWDNGGKGWKTTAQDWASVYDTGAGHSITAISVVGDTTYVAWCGPCNASGFARGVATNAGGTWHPITGTLPRRFLQGLTADPANPSHVYAVANGYSRRWVPNADLGHIFESINGGMTWTDISGNLPDAPGNEVVLSHGKLVLGTDIGAFTATAGQGATTVWSRLGSGLPAASVNEVTLTPDGKTIIAATHGRGIWTITAP